MIQIDIKKTLANGAHPFELDIKTSVKTGQFVTIYGNSGAGKTSLLRVIAGLITPDSGIIRFDNNLWYSSSNTCNLSPQKRNVGFVFQDYALFPNMTILENLEYGLKKNQSKDVVEELISIMELEHLKDRMPTTLSGGQKQRVALARALVQRPKLLLLDEPLSALDDEMRYKLQGYLLEVHKTYNLTTFLVSHDMSEVFRLSDHVIKIHQGKVVAEGAPNELFLSKQSTGKYRTIGTVLSIQKADVVFIVNVLSGTNVIRVVVTEKTAKTLNPGDSVVISSKAFNPIIEKI